MRKNFIVTIAFVVTLFSCANVAFASFFDDGRWYMDSEWWELYIEDPENRTSFLDQNNRLEYITTFGGWTDEYDADRFYDSKWMFDLNHDFAFTVDFRYDHTGSYNNDEGVIGVAVWGRQCEVVGWWARQCQEDDDDNSMNATMGAGNWVAGENWLGTPPTNRNIYFSDINLPEAGLVVPPAMGGYDHESFWRRVNSNGRFYVTYTSSSDQLRFFSLDEGDTELSGGAEYEGIRTILGFKRLGISFGGGSEGAGLNSGDAYLENFNVLEGIMRPDGSLNQ